MNDYERIARVIRYLDEHHDEQPDLATLAGQAGLSLHHFHRLFSNWAAITPKDFLQCLTVSYAKEQLRKGKSVLDAALASGLSGPGRLHDLCVNLEAASPGEIKSGGNGWTIQAGFAESPFGRCFIAESPRGICHLSFIGTEDETTCFAILQKNWPQAQIIQDDTFAAQITKQVFRQPDDTSPRPTLRAYVQGTDFQVKVWRALVQVQSGAMVSYGQLASALGKPSASRAVGSAVAQNSLAYLVPCHRVIRETGVIGEYRWGHERKCAMLARESVMT